VSWIKNRPLNIVLRVQLFVTVVAAIIAGFFYGTHDAISAMLGGMISVVSAAVFAIIISRHKGYTAGETVRAALRAEAVKIILTIGLLWMVFKFYENVSALAFIGTFILAVLVYSMALLVSDDTK
jgi:ATP synthase protein I